MSKRIVTITFSDKEKAVDLNTIASVVAKTLRKGGAKNDKRKEIS